MPVHRWLVLEEHAVAVSAAVVWGKAQGKPWWPAQTVCRSALELAISSMSEEADGIVLPASKSSKKSNIVALTLFFGEQTTCELKYGKGEMRLYSRLLSYF